MLATLWWPLAIAALDWVLVSAGSRWRTLERVVKPAAILALMAWLAWRAALAGAWPTVLNWFMAGLAASLAGDVLLTLPPRWFVAGLAAFLLAHLAYAVGFNVDGLPPLTAWPWALPLVIISGWLGARLVRGLRAGGQPSLVGPVLVYIGAISLMVFSALACLSRPGWSSSAALLAGAGAVLFMLSDGVLGWDRFVRPVRQRDLAVLIPYHLGQMCLIAGAAARWVS